MNKNLLYRRIPKVDVLLEFPEIRSLICEYGHMPVLEAIRSETDELRRRIREAPDDCDAGEEPGDDDPAGFETGDSAGVETNIENIISRIAARTRAANLPNLKKVINASGTILHTNLGRAPLMRDIFDKAADILAGYSNLEYDLGTGTRGERYSHFEDVLRKLTGAEAAMAVNNNAAAVLLILSTLARDGEVVVSRGELVEIGGKFRVPDVCAMSGAKLREVGTTNRTRISDYEEAVTPETRAFLKVHTSNYRIVGFTESVSAAEMKISAEKLGIPVIEDLGSGVFVNLEKYGLAHEPTVQEAVSAGVDVVCFSGDKLLGGPQAGIIAGKKEYIDLIKKNPLTRALRIDKFTVAALELTLMKYLDEEKAVKEIPVLKMITESLDENKKRAENLRLMIAEKIKSADVFLAECDSQIGGGALPLETIRGNAIVIKPHNMSAAALERRMLAMPVPVVARTQDDSMRLDVRTVEDGDFKIIAEELSDILEHR